MFSKTDKSKSQSLPPAPKNEKAPAAQKPNRNIPSILSADLHIVGNVSTDGDIQIDGRVEGDVQSGSLTVGERAAIKGEVMAASVTVNGTVEGRIRAGQVFLSKSARVIGDILHEKLSIEAGAFLEGCCRHIDAAEAAHRPSAGGQATTTAQTEPAARPDERAGSSALSAKGSATGTS